MPCLYIRLSGFLDEERSFVGGVVANIKFFLPSWRVVFGRSSNEVVGTSSSTAAMV